MQGRVSEAGLFWVVSESRLLLQCTSLRTAVSSSCMPQKLGMLRTSPNVSRGNVAESILHVAWSVQTNIHWYSTIVNAVLGLYSTNVVQSDLISETLVLFVISTTGSGAEPRSMTSMWKTLLRSDLPPDLFDDLSFAVFGLGDTAYEKFCWPAKKLARRLVSLGATEICDRGEGDDQDPLG